MFTVICECGAKSIIDENYRSGDMEQDISFVPLTDESIVIVCTECNQDINFSY